jgi:hypothetical protein
MGSKRSVDLAERVVAWHNRHPLARRITRAQVASIGLVGFPFRAPAGSAAAARAARASASEATPQQGTLRQRALAQAAGSAEAAQDPAVEEARALPGPSPEGRRGWRRAFNEAMLAPTSLGTLTRWLLREGSEVRPGPADVPQRELDAGIGGPRGAPATWLWCWTAAVELGGLRVRLLASPFAPHAVLGRRLLHPGRIGTLGVALMLLAGGGWWWQRGSGVASPAAAMVGAAPAPAASAAGSGAAGITNVAQRPAQRPSPMPTPASAGAGTPVHPADEAPLAAAGAPPARAQPMRLPPTLDESTRRAAREASELARADLAERRRARARPPTAASSPAPGVAAQAAGAAPAAGQRNSSASLGTAATVPLRAPAAPPALSPALSVAPPAAAAAGSRSTWAVTTRNLRTRFEGEQMLAALRDAARRTGQAGELKLEVISAGDDWRAVGWPFTSPAEAERLRAALAERGLKTQVVMF